MNERVVSFTPATQEWFAVYAVIDPKPGHPQTWQAPVVGWAVMRWRDVEGKGTSVRPMVVEDGDILAPPSAPNYLGIVKYGTDAEEELGWALTEYRKRQKADHA